MVRRGKPGAPLRRWRAATIYNLTVKDGPVEFTVRLAYCQNCWTVTAIRVDRPHCCSACKVPWDHIDTIYIRLTRSHGTWSVEVKEVDVPVPHIL